MATLKATSGSLGTCGFVTDPTFRAETTQATPGIVTLDWAYLGASSIDGPLDSGVIRRQIGLKLQSANPCNLIYLMREVEPESRIFVQIKLNPGKRTSDDCGSDGYINLGDVNVPLVRVGKLQARFVGETLEAYENGTKVLTVSLAKLKLPKGHYGVRSDSGRFFFKLSP